MASTFKVLGQVAPAATTDTVVYTVPATTNTTISSVTICNRAATTATFRLYVAVAGAALDNKQYIYYDQTIDGNSTYIATIGITLNTTDVLKIYCSTANFSVSAFGIEVTT